MKRQDAIREALLLQGAVVHGEVAEYYADIAERAVQAWERTHVDETTANANRVRLEHLDRLCFEVSAKPPARRRPGRGGHDDRYYRDLAKTHRALFRKLKRPPSIGELHRTFDGAAPPRSTLYRHLQTARERGYLA